MENKSITDVKVQKGKMHKVLNIPEDELIEDYYKSPVKLVNDLIAKVGKEKATGMIAYAANITKKDNIFDKALKTIAKMNDEEKNQNLNESEKMENKEVFVGFLFKNKNDKVFYGCKRTSMLENENIHDFMERIMSTIDNTDKGRVSQLAVYESESKKYYCGSTEFGGMKYTIAENSEDVYFTTKTPMFVYLNEKYFNIITTGDSASIAYKECNLILQYPKLIANVILPINENYVSSQTHSLFDFIINTLNINFHPDDKFEDYLVNNSIIDIDGKILEFDEASLKYIEAQIGLCFEYLEDDIYEIGMDIIMPRIQPAPKN